MRLLRFNSIPKAVALLCCLLAGTAFPAVRGRHYPSVRGAKLEMVISGARTESKEVVIRDVMGRPAYRLTVYAVSLNTSDVESITVELNGMGAAVAESEVRYEPNLLNPDRWGHGAGQRKFTAQQLCPANRNRPYWGARRVFALRGMRIKVGISEIEMSKGFAGIRKARVRVNVMPSSVHRSRPADFAYREPIPCA